MQHSNDAFRRDNTATNPSAADFTNAVPRGEVLRRTEPVVAPVATTPVEEPTPVTNGTPVASRSIMNDPDAGIPRPTRPHNVTGVRDRRFSLGATFLGWAVASFFTLVFSSILLFALGAAALQSGDDGALTAGDVTTLSIAGLIGLLVAMFLAYLIGGYAAGRIAHWNGAKHGAIVPVWTIFFGLLAVVAGTAFGAQAAGYLGPYLPSVDAGTFTTYGALGILAMIVVDFLGAILGGILGAKGDQRHEAGAVERRRTMRGRPL